MPNWCTNVLTIKGDASEIKRLVKKVKSGECAFSFNKVIPMPKELSEIQSGGCTIDGQYVRAWKVVDGQNVMVDEEKLRNKYGATSWHDWACEHWGTKWDTSNEVKGPTYGLNGKGVVFEFSTAWSSPEPVIEKLSELFPKLNFHMRWYEEGGCKGQFCFENGEAF